MPPISYLDCHNS